MSCLELGCVQFMWMDTESWLWQSTVSIVPNILKSLKNFKHFNNIKPESLCLQSCESKFS